MRNAKNRNRLSVDNDMYMVIAATSTFVRNLDPNKYRIIYLLKC